MRTAHLLSATLLLVFTALSSLHAQSANSPYSVVVPVTDTSDAQRNQAFTTALGQVMSRVAGGQDLRSNPGYGEVMTKARAIVQKYQYERAETGLVLNVDFEAGAVRRLVSQLGVRSAGIKPPVLLLVQGSDGQLLDASALASLTAAAGARGTNVVFPAASGAPDLTQIAAVDPVALAQVNRQYGTGLVLLGKLRADGADWTLVSGGQVQSWSDRGVDVDQVLSDAGNGLANHLGKQLNVIGSASSEGKLWISGLSSAMDYADLIATLKQDPSVSQVITVEANNDAVLLRVKASLPISGLAANLAAGGRMLLQGEPHAGADANLRWLKEGIQ